MNKTQIIKEIKAVKTPENMPELPPMEQLAVYWGVIAAVLKFIKIFTNQKNDSVIDDILLWGEQNFPK